MTLNAANVAGAPTGSLNRAPYGTTAPTGTASAITPFTDLGYVSDDGVTLTLPDAGDKTALHAWQGGAVVRVFRSPSDDNPTIQCTLIETKKETVETFYGTTVTQTTTEGTFDFISTAARTYFAYVLDVIDGSQLRRIYVPRGIISAVGDQTFANADVVGYNVTIEAELDPTLNINFRSWATLLKSSS